VKVRKVGAKIISQEEEDGVCQISLYRMAKKKD